MDFVTLTIDILNNIARFAGSYGMAIILFTIISKGKKQKNTFHLTIMFDSLK